MPNKTSDARTQLVQDILSYLAAHPQSEDSVEGIVEWWLLRHYVTQTRAAVRAALCELVTRRLVLERIGGDGRVTFRLNSRQRALALKLARVTR